MVLVVAVKCDEKTKLCEWLLRKITELEDVVASRVRSRGFGGMEMDVELQEQVVANAIS